MSERDDPQMGKVVRGISRGLGAILVLWALSDDALIGGGPGFGLTQAAMAGIGLSVFGSSFASLTWNTRVLALVLSTGFVLAVGEVGLRALYSARFQRPYELDEQALYKLVPGATREHVLQPINGGARIRYQINNDGFRGAELETDPQLRIVVYGDSFIQGEFSSLEQTFAERLEHYLSRRLLLQVEVVNAGVAGYGPDQSLRKMERELTALAPDLVVIAVFAGNDFGDLLRNKLFRVDQNGSLIPTAFTIDPDQRRGLLVRHRELMLKRVLREAFHALGAMIGIRAERTSEVQKMDPADRVEFFRAERIREYDEYIVRGDDVVRELAWDSYDADVSLTPSSDSARYRIRLMGAVLSRMKSLTSSLSVPLVLVPIPHPIDVGGHATGAVDRERYPEYEPRGLVRILERIAAREQIPVVDLFTPFDELGSEVVYFQGEDDHWNDLGQDIAGRLVADFLVDNQLLVPAAKSEAASPLRAE